MITIIILGGKFGDMRNAFGFQRKLGTRSRIVVSPPKSVVYKTSLIGV